MGFNHIKIAKKYLSPNGKILDLGAGEMEEIRELKRLGYVCEGVDLKTGTDLEKPYLSKQAPFDMVMSNFVLHFLTNKNQLIKTAYDNLSDGGVFYFQDLEYQAITGKMYLTQKQLENLITAGGFKILSSTKSRYFDPKPSHRHYHNILEITALKPLS